MAQDSETRRFSDRYNSEANADDGDHDRVLPRKDNIGPRQKVTLGCLLFGVGLLIGKISTELDRTATSDVLSSITRKRTDPTNRTRRVAQSGLFTPMNRTGATIASVASPRIAWLMSFPNSGTSYTSRLVRTVTGKNTATNYGHEENFHNSNIPCWPVHKKSPSGPFWSDPLNPRLSHPTKGYILTKTHCGGRCSMCEPKKYIENHHSFLKDCLKEEYLLTDKDGNTTWTSEVYSKDLVFASVHLIRDPFDNVVSRFHLAFKNFIRNNGTKSLNRFPKSREGFRAFCEQMHTKYQSQEQSGPYAKFYRDVFDVVKDVPCHADFFRYIQWHNLAFTTTWDLGIDGMILHYENYTVDFNETKDGLLRFLGQDEVHDPPVFVTGKTYRDYFTTKEVHAVERMFSELALTKTWRYTQHYFNV